MWTRRAIVLFGLVGLAVAASAQDFRTEDVSAAQSADAAQLHSGTIAFSDHNNGDPVDSSSYLIRFEDWANRYPTQKKFLALYPSYVERTDVKPASGEAEASNGKLYMYIAQARFALDRPPGSIDLSRYVTLAFLEKIDPSLKHTAITAADVAPFRPELGNVNDNPDRKWCTGHTTSICIQSSYKLEGKIPLGVALANKLRDSGRKVDDHIDFQSEFSALSPAELDQSGLQDLTKIATPVTGALDQTLFYVNEIIRWGKFLAVFQNSPADPNKTVVTAFMALAIDAVVLDRKREYENVPVLRNLVPAQVLMGQSSFNSGDSISAGLPKYARNEIMRIAGILEHDAGK
jgi:hypothetical protein